MQVQEKMDREVKIWSLLRAALRHWRIILILSLVFAAAGAVFYERSFKKDLTAAEDARAMALAAQEAAGVLPTGTVVAGNDTSGSIEATESSDGTGKVQTEQNEEAEEPLEEDFSNLNLQNVETLIAEIEAKGQISVRELLTSLDAVDRAMDGMRTYMANSIKMKIDPYAAWQSICEIYVDTAEGAEQELSTTVLNHMLSRYRSALTSKVDYTSLATELNSQRNYIRELININPDYDAGIIRYSIYHYDREDLEKIVTAISDQLKQEYAAIEADYGPHKLRVLLGGFQLVYNSDLVSFSTNAWKNYYTLESTIASYKKRANEALQALASGDGSGMVDIDNPETELPELPKDSRVKLVIYAVAGYILGVVALTFLFMLIILLRGRIVDGNDLAGHGVRTLTELTAKRKGKALKGLDALLDRIGRTKDFVGSDAERLQKAAGFIGEYGEGAKRLLLTGDVSTRQLATIAKELSANGLPQEFVCQPGLFSDPKTVEALKGCDGIVLVEEPLKSSYRLAANDVLVAADWEKPVLGAIYL